MSQFVIANDSVLSVGDDVFAKPAGDDFVGSPWRGDDVTALPQSITATSYSKTFNLPAASLDAAKSYYIFSNTYRSTFTTNYASDANQLLSANIASADVGSLCYVKGTSLSGGFVAGKPYWVINVVDGVAFELEATQGSGTPVTLTSDGTGMSYTLASRRSSSDFDSLVATLPATESSLEGEGYISAELQYILSIHGWLADGGRTDLLIDAILEDTGTSLPATLAAIQAKTDLVGSSAAALATTISSSSIQTQVGSTKSVTIACNTDVSAKTLVVTFETLRSKTDIATVADGSVTKSSNNATFALPAAATSSERTLRFTIKDTTTDEAYAAGLLFVSYDAKSD